MTNLHSPWECHGIVFQEPVRDKLPGAAAASAASQSFLPPLWLAWLLLEHCCLFARTHYKMPLCPSSFSPSRSNFRVPLQKRPPEADSRNTAATVRSARAVPGDRNVSGRVQACVAGRYGRIRKKLQRQANVWMEKKKFDPPFAQGKAKHGLRDAHTRGQCFPTVEYPADHPLFWFRVLTPPVCHNKWEGVSVR